jgi:hypothetical protein
MSEATTEHVNGTAPPAPAAEPCEDCASNGEKLLAVLAAALGAFVIVMAFDMFTGGKISGMVREKVPQ